MLHFTFEAGLVGQPVGEVGRATQEESSFQVEPILASRGSEEDHLVKFLLTYLATVGAVESRVRDAFLLRLATFTF